MARYGQKLLRQLTFQYCDTMGCSQGMREYIHSVLPAFKQRHPDVVIKVEERSSVTKEKRWRSRFPLVKAEYDLLPNNAAHLERSLQRRQQQHQQQHQQQAQQQQQQQQQQQRAQPQWLPRLNSNVICVKSQSAAEIRAIVWWLTQSQCRPRTSRIPAKHIVSRNRSIQGPWTATTF